MRLVGRCRATLFARFNYATATITPRSIKVGDIVEINKSLGIVKFCAIDRFDVQDLNRQSHIAKLDDISLAITPDKPIIDTWQLSGFSHHSRDLERDLEVYLKVLYAKYSQPHRLAAFDFDTAVRLILWSRFKSDTEPSVQQILAVYSLLNKSPFFTRIGRSPFAAVAQEPDLSSPASPSNPFLRLLAASPPQKLFGKPVEDAPLMAVPALYSSGDLGINFQEKFDLFQISICLPIIPWRSTLDGTIDVGLRGLSVPGTPLVDNGIKRKFSLNKNRAVTCIVVSALISPWNNQVVETSVELASVYGEHIKWKPDPFVDRKQIKHLNNISTICNALVPSPQRCDLEQPLKFKEPRMAKQARHLASAWAAEWAAANDVSLIFLRKEKFKSWEDAQDEDVIGLEALSSVPGPHEYLDAKGYAAIGYPFDSALSAANQQLLLTHLRTAKPHQAYALPAALAARTFQQQVLPSMQLASAVQMRAKKHDTFQSLRENHRVFLRCTILKEAVVDELCEARCLDIGFNVFIRASLPVKAGDTVICTSVERVDADELILVLRM